MMGFRTTKTYPQESLAQAVWAILRQELVVLFALWLSIGFPILCQQHGLMSVFDLDIQNHSGDHGLVTNLDPHASHRAEPGANPLATGCSVANHSASPLANMTLSSIVVLLPQPIATPDSSAPELVQLPREIWPLQVTLRAPEEPPRWL